LGHKPLSPHRLSLEEVADIALRDFGCQIFCAGNREGSPDFFVCALLPGTPQTDEHSPLRRLHSLYVPDDTTDRLRRFCGVVGITLLARLVLVENWYQQ